MKNKNIKQRNSRNSESIKYALTKGLFIGIILLSSLFAKAQTQQISINLSDTTVEAIINELKKQTDINFIYNNELISKSPKVSLSITNGTVEQALKQCFKTTNLTFKKTNNTIVITPAEEGSVAPVSKPNVLTQTLRGKIIDRDSKMTLPFANVIVLNTNPMIGAPADVDGNFAIENLPVGRYSIKVSYMGYEDAVLSEILLGSAKEVVLTVEISEKVASLGEINVTVKKGEPLNEMATISAKSFSVEETQRYAASISDPARMAQAFAGVSTGDDASNEIIIRGNSPNWLLWRLEGVEIPNPNHFAEEGYSAGAVSILSSNMLSRSDFYTGAFPAEFGSALSGVFDIRLRNGNNQKNEFSFQAGVLGLDFSAEGPFKKGYDGSYLINYRYSTLSILNLANIHISENTLPNYQDLSFKVNLSTKKAGTFALWGVGGISDSDEKYLPDSTLNEDFEDGYSDNTKYGMYATGLSHTIFPDKKSYVKTVISQSMGYSSQTYDVMDSLGVLRGDFFDELKNRAVRVSSFYNRKLSSRLTLRMGAVYNELNYSYYTREIDSTQNWNTYINSADHTQLYQAYAQSKYKFSDNITFTAGLHYAHFALSNDNSLEPRLGLTFDLPKRQKLSLGYGHHSKNENLIVYFVEVEKLDGSVYMPNKDLKMSRSTHYILSYEKMLGKNMSLKAETYYQSISSLPVPNNPNKYWSPIFGGVLPEDTLANIGEGRNYGLELTLQKYFSNNYYFMFSSSLFNSEYKPADGQWYNTKYNVNYINNLVGGKEYKWGENKLLGINGKVIWSGGKRMNYPIDLEASIEEGTTVLDENVDIFSTQGSDYFRVDLGIRLHFFKEKTEHIISLDVQNLTNRANQWFEFYNKETQSIEDYPMAGLIPIVNYKIVF